MVVRLGKDGAGSQILLSPTLNHISLWCEDFAVDFGNAALSCPSASTPNTEPEMEAGDEPADATAVPPATPEEASGSSSMAAATAVMAAVAAAAVAVM